MKMILSHTIHFNIKNIHSVFYVDWLCFTTDNISLNQFQLNDQSVSIYVNNKKSDI